MFDLSWNKRRALWVIIHPRFGQTALPCFSDNPSDISPNFLFGNHDLSVFIWEFQEPTGELLQDTWLGDLPHPSTHTKWPSVSSAYLSGQPPGTLSVCDLSGFSLISSSAIFQLGSKPEPSIVPICLCVCYCVFRGRKRCHKELTGSAQRTDKAEMRREKKIKEIKVNEREEGSGRFRDLRTLTVSPAYE